MFFEFAVRGFVGIFWPSRVKNKEIENMEWKKKRRIDLAKNILKMERIILSKYISEITTQGIASGFHFL